MWMKRLSKAKGDPESTMDEESRGDFAPLGISSPSTRTSMASLTSREDFSSTTKTPNKGGLRDQLHQFKVMSAPYFRENRQGKILFVIMVVLTLANSAVRVFFSYLARDFWNALSDKDEDRFYSVMGKFVGSMFVLAPITVLYRYQRQKLAIAWRKWLTGRVLRLYFSNKVRTNHEMFSFKWHFDVNNATYAIRHLIHHTDHNLCYVLSVQVYYALERQSGVAKAENVDGNDTTNDYNDTKKEVDNPDQRISEDIRSFTEFSLSFFLTILTSIVDLVSFSFILFSIMPQLFLAIFAFAAIGTIATVCLGKILIRLNYESLQKEADFRFSLVRVRENAESIAFYAGETVEEKETDRRFDHVIGNMIQVNTGEFTHASSKGTRHIVAERYSYFPLTTYLLLF